MDGLLLPPPAGGASADAHDAYIVVTFVNATVVLSIGESVEEVTDSGFLLTTPTVNVTQLGDDSLLQVRSRASCGGGTTVLTPALGGKGAGGMHAWQVYPEGVRHIRSDRRINEWKAPTAKPIAKAAVNQRQVRAPRPPDDPRVQATGACGP